MNELTADLLRRQLFRFQIDTENIQRDADEQAATLKVLLERLDGMRATVAAIEEDLRLLGLEAAFERS